MAPGLKALLLLALFAAGYGCKKSSGPAAAAPGGIPVQVVAVEARRQPVMETLSLVGSLLANEVVEVKSEIEGTIQKIGFDEGQRIEKGHPLVELDDSILSAIVAEADANFKLTQTTFERNKQLFSDNLISRQEFDQSQAAFFAAKATLERRRSELAHTKIFASFPGIVGSRQISPGQVIGKNTTITWLVDLDRLKAEFSVPERFLSQLKVGQTVELLVAAYPQEKFAGEVYFIAPQVDPATRTALVRAYVANPQHRLKPGMFANLDLALRVRENAIVIPEPALMPLGDRITVLIVDKELTAQIRPVKVGMRIAGQVEILSGLQPGDLVVVEGTQKARPGGKVKLAPPEAAQPYLQPAPTGGVASAP